MLTGVAQNDLLEAPRLTHIRHDLLEGAIRVACEEFLSDVSPLESVRLTGEAIAPDRSVMEFEFLRKVESVMSLPNHNAKAGEVAGG